MKKKKNKSIKSEKEEWEGFDDCPICQAMKNSTANSPEGLKKAFAEANAQDFQNHRMATKVQDKNDLYYDAMDALNENNYKAAEKMLLKARDMDPDYVQTYVGLTATYNRPEDKKKIVESIKTGFEKVLKKFPKWPKKMEWGDMDSRAYLRAIQYRADLYADEGEKNEVEKLYRLILKLNPYDNQGVRYVLAGMFTGISGDEMDKMFDEGNKKQDWSKLEKLVKNQNNIYKFWKRPKN